MTRPHARRASLLLVLALASAAWARSPDGGAETAAGLGNLYGSDLGEWADTGGPVDGGGVGTVAVRGDAPVVTGSIPTEVLRDLIHSHHEEVAACAARGKGRGRLMVSWKILPTGAVTGAQVKASALQAPAIEQCVLDAVRRWVFPKPLGGGVVVVNYPFVFVDAPGDAGVPAQASPSPCPATRAEVRPGSACTPSKVETCRYPRGAWCACEGTSCVTAAGPIPGCVSTLRWTCRDDGCPRQPAGACAREGLQCTYDDGLCAAVAECRGNAWTMGRANCRPAAAPQGGR